MAQLGHRPVFIISYSDDIDGYASGAITFINNFFISRPFQLSCALHNSPFDIISWHIDGFSLSNSLAQTRVFLWITPSLAGGYADFPDQLGEQFAALGVDSCLFMFYRMPF